MQKKNTERLTFSLTRDLSFNSKVSGSRSIVGTEGVRFPSAPPLQPDGFDVGWCSVVDVDEACVSFLFK